MDCSSEPCDDRSVFKLEIDNAGSSPSSRSRNCGSRDAVFCASPVNGAPLNECVIKGLQECVLWTPKKDITESRECASSREFTGERTSIKFRTRGADCSSLPGTVPFGLLASGICEAPAMDTSLSAQLARFPEPVQYVLCDTAAGDSLLQSESPTGSLACFPIPTLEGRLDSLVKLRTMTQSSITMGGVVALTTMPTEPRESAEKSAGKSAEPILVDGSIAEDGAHGECRSSGVTGVYWHRTRKAWCARYKNNGKSLTKWFPVKSLGNEEALKQAVAFRREGLESGKASSKDSLELLSVSGKSPSTPCQPVTHPSTMGWSTNRYRRLSTLFTAPDSADAAFLSELQRERITWNETQLAWEVHYSLNGRHFRRSFAVSRNVHGSLEYYDASCFGGRQGVL